MQTVVPISRGWWRALSGRGRTPLAWRNLTHKKGGLLVSAGAVAFAVLIMFMELGFRNGLYDSQTLVFRHLRADLVLISPERQFLVAYATFPRSRLEQAAAVEGVRAVRRIYTEETVSLFKNPATGTDNGVRVFGIDPRAPIFAHEEIERRLPLLEERFTLLWDRQSRAFLGPVGPGTESALAGRRVRVAEVFTLGADYYFDGNVITSEETFFTLFPQRHPDRVKLGLVQLEPGVRVGEARERLRRVLAGGDVEVLSVDEIMAREKAAWRQASPAGDIFAMGVVVGFIIGVVICYQILYTDIADHLPQLATMKALGYHGAALVRLVLGQALFLGVLGFVPAVLMTLGLYTTLTELTGIETRLTVGRVLLVFGLTLAMCLASGLLAVRKVLRADPAELFR